MLLKNQTGIIDRKGDKLKRKVICIVSCIIPILIIGLCVHKLNYIFRPTDTDGAFEQINTFHNLPSESLDIIVYGSSLAYRGVDSLTLSELCGVTAYNYGYNWQKINTTKLFVMDSFLTQSPKLALIECRFAHQPLDDVNMDAQIYYTRYLNVDKERRDYLKKCFGGNLERYLSYYCPLIAFHDNWSSLSSKSFLPLNREETILLTTMGASTGSETITPIVIPDQSSLPQMELSQSAVAELQEIVDLCKKNNTEVLFFSAPYAGVNQYSNAMKSFADDNDCKYVDMFEYIDEIQLDANTDFHDDSHLNQNGVIKMTSFLGKYICDNYDCFMK